MWPFKTKYPKVKNIVAITPPILGKFEDHLKVIEKIYPTFSKEEIKWMEEALSTGSISTLHMLSPLDDNLPILTGWEITHPHGPLDGRKLGENWHECSGFFKGTCCSGTLPLMKNRNNLMERDIQLPESFLTRGSFVMEISSVHTKLPTQYIQLTEEEHDYIFGQEQEED